MQNYGILQSPLSIMCQEREAWKLVERMSRSNKDRKLHAFSKHRIDELSDQIVSIAHDEMTSDASDEEENIDDNQSDAVDFTD